MNLTGRPQDGPSFWGSLFQKASLPVAGFWSGLRSKFDVIGTAFADKEELLRQKETLEAQLGVLEYLESRLVEVEAENARLRELLKFKDTATGSYQVAEVFGREPSNGFVGLDFHRSLDDVQPTPRWCLRRACGRTLSVGDHVPTVLLLTVRQRWRACARSRDLGVVLGGDWLSLLPAFSRDADAGG